MAWISEPLSSEALIGVLAVVLWCAWAHFVVCVAREIVTQRRSRGVAGATSGGHPLARRLVATALLVAGTVTVTAQTAQAAAGETVSGTTSSLVSRAATEMRTVGDVAAEASDRATAERALERLQRVETGVAHGKDAGVRHGLGLRYQVQPRTRGTTTACGTSPSGP